jgi:hydroxymethylglutaryl-CoA lyase
MRFDGALKGVGGCPMAEDKLVGNMNSELMIPYFEKLGILKNINPEELQKAIQMASKIFA